MNAVHSLSGGLGGKILDTDVAALGSDAAIETLLAAFYAHQVIVIPNQTLTPGEFAGFARIFGRPQPHILSHLRHPEHPEILPLSNVFKDGEPTGVYDGAAYWHTDMSYEEEPGAVTLVYSIQAPEQGGETCFADMYRAYETLPEKTKGRIDRLTVLHHYGNRADLEEASRTSAFALTDDQKQQAAKVHHPLVRRHPVTGRKALYAVAGSSFAIVGLPDDEAVTLLDELRAHATQSDFVYRHHYEAGDVVAWDNFSTLHAATLIPPATGPRDTRLLHRISVKGEPILRPRMPHR